MASAPLTGPPPTVAPGGTGGDGVTVHNALTGRSANNAHPISAVTGLAARLPTYTNALSDPPADPAADGSETWAPIDLPGVVMTWTQYAEGQFAWTALLAGVGDGYTPELGAVQITPLAVLLTSGGRKVSVDGQGLHLGVTDSPVIYATQGDPTAGDGYPAPVGSVLLRNNEGTAEQWRKVGDGDTDWQLDSTAMAATLVDVVGAIGAVDGSEANATIDGIGSQPIAGILGFLGSPLTALLSAGDPAENGIYQLTADEDAPNGYSIELVETPAEGATITRRARSQTSWSTAQYEVLSFEGGALGYSLDADPDGVRAIHVSDQDVINDIVVIRGVSRWRWTDIEIDIDGARRYFLFLAGGDAIIGSKARLRLGWNAGGEERPDFAIVTPNKLGQPTGTAWDDSSHYDVGAVRFTDAGLKTYVAKVEHDSSDPDTEPGIGGDWETYWDLNTGSTDHGNALPAEWMSQIDFTGNVTVGTRGGGRSYTEALAIDHKPEDIGKALMIERIDEDGKAMPRLRDPLGPQVFYTPGDGDTVELPNGTQRAWFDLTAGAATAKLPDPSLNQGVVIEISAFAGSNPVTLEPFDGETMFGTGAVPATYIATYAEANGDWYQTAYRSWD